MILFKQFGKYHKQYFTWSQPPFKVLLGLSPCLHQNSHHPLDPSPKSGYSLVHFHVCIKISTIHLIPAPIPCSISMCVPKFPPFSWSQLPLGFSFVHLLLCTKISTIHLIPAPIQDSPRSVYVRTKISTILMIPAPFRVLFGPSLHLHQNFHHPLNPCPHSGFSTLRLCPYQNFHYSHDPSSL